MRLFIQLLAAGVTGGLIVLGGSNILFPHNQKEASIRYDAQPTFASNQSASVYSMPNDFVESAKKSTGSVVHIFAEESEDQVLKRRKSKEEMILFLTFLVLKIFLVVAIFMHQKTVVDRA
jgi:hypothetical protein